MEDKYYERLMELIKIPLANNDIPVSALIVDKNGNIIAEGYNDRVKNNTISGHAEINAINQALKDNTKLNDCVIYTTLEPCGMCYSAIRQAKIKSVDYILNNDKNDVTRSFALHDNYLSLNKNTTKEQEEEYQTILSEFFNQNIR
ncbi:nucleoside deaminase [Mesoplasma lactucae]|uniref:tRNA-specific adenosine deaminase n=1 Tax=Mesoplasma lactucae ATCC 49193 TaxID=81460 RepID=A0A291ISI9_9MOLU|nr:nucleoside deaminase [Mesoplasma lactucae]ATG97698.1 tRNA-specific adenosine deaminase [Mesoplasma lactucae ATCC 49193]ATZ19836.1 tRNA-specific adenosine deaminase [Mesoplasma lactucae ATCC 49193]MCL8216699.1 Guanine deaminase [Mesoplasma lactucae ATCC 49193]